MSYLSSASLYHANFAIQDFEASEMNACEADQEAAQQELFEKADFVAVVLNDFDIFSFDKDFWQINSAGFHSVDFSELNFIEIAHESLGSTFFKSSLNRDELIQQLSLAIVLSCDATNDSDKDLGDLPIPF